MRDRIRTKRLRRLAVALIAFAAVAIVGGVQSPAQAAGSLPCDIYASAGTPCVAAHSTVRALFSAYSGNLYQVKRASDSTTLNIGVVAAGSYANASAQDTFCANTICTITEIYDQTSNHNNLTIEGSGGAGAADWGANAAALPITIGGHKAYGVYVSPRVGYRDDSTTAVATGSQPEGEYMVASGTHVNSSCCFDYGNAETNNKDTGNGHMDAINFGTECWFSPCQGSGPWVQADEENGLFAGGNGAYSGNTGISNKNFVTAMLKNNGTSSYAIKGGNAQSGSLTTFYSGALPTTSGYNPMHKEGAIVLGTGGDNSNGSVGSFFEGVMTSGYPSDATDNAVQTEIVAAGYGGSSNGATREIVGTGSSKCLDVPNQTHTDGTQLELYTCNGGSNQEWVYAGNKELVVYPANKCLDVSGQSTSPSAKVDMYTCNGGANQQWNLNSNGTITGVQSGLCLDAKGAATANGTLIEIYTCNGGSNQKWSLS